MSKGRTFISLSANAALHGRLPLTPGGTDYQAAYDDVLKITWLTNAALSGPGTWDSQVAWAADLASTNYLGFDGWRLASMSVAAGLPTGSRMTIRKGAARPLAVLPERHGSTRNPTIHPISKNFTYV